MTFYCTEKAKGRNCGAKETLGIPQCHYCYEYQRGYVEPSSPVPALQVDSMSDLGMRWATWVDDDAAFGKRW